MPLLEHEMFSELSLRGRWWLPSRPDDQVPGTLHFSNDRIEIRLDSAFQDPALMSTWATGSYKAPIILGYTTDGISCSVFKAVFRRWSSDEVILVANAILLGAHVEDEKQFGIREATIRFTHLEEWAAPRLVRQDQDAASEKLIITAPLQPSTLLCVEGIDQLKRLVLRAGVQSSFERNHASLTNEVRLVLEFEPPCTMVELNRFVRRISNLLSLLVGQAVYPRKIDIGTLDEVHGVKQPIEYLFALRAPPPNKVYEFEMILPLPMLGESGAQNLFRGWFSNDERLRPVCDLLLSTVYNPSQYVQSTFLSLAQAMESFHRRAFVGTYIPQIDYERIQATLTAAIPEGIPQDLNGKLTSMLAWGNELSLRNRLKQLFDGLDQDYAKNLAGKDDLRKFIKLMVDVRNYLTHYDEKNRPPIIDSLPELYNFNQRIRAILTLLIFRYLGVDKDKVFLPLKGNLHLAL